MEGEFKPFDPRSARGRASLPIWVDALHRDTQELEANEIGSYLLILFCMWQSKICALPYDKKKIARAARVTTNFWSRTLSKKLEPFFEKKDGYLLHNKLRKEAHFIESYLTKQRCNKTGENPDKYLKLLTRPSTMDVTMDPTMDASYHLPLKEKKKNIQKKKDEKKIGSTPLFSENDMASKKENDGQDPFEMFWIDAFPHRGNIKRGKAEAKAKWSTAIKSTDPKLIIDAARRYASWLSSPNPQNEFRAEPPDPARWLHRERWNDDLGSARSQTQKSNPDQRRNNLEAIASKMIKSGSHWMHFNTIVNDTDLAEIERLGLMPVEDGR